MLKFEHFWERIPEMYPLQIYKYVTVSDNIGVSKTVILDL